MAETTPIQPQAGNIVVERRFTVGGNKKAKKVLPLMSFTSSIVFKDSAEMRECAAKYVVWLAQNKVRVAYDKRQPIPFPQGRTFTMDAEAKTTLSPADKAQQAMDLLLAKPELILNATPAQKAALLKLLTGGVGSVTPEEMTTALALVPRVDEYVDGEVVGESESGGLADCFKYDENQLEQLSLQKLRQLAQNEELEGYSELSREDLIEELAMIEV